MPQITPEQPQQTPESDHMSRQELLLRLAGGTLLASAILTTVANLSSHVQGYEIGPDPTGPHTKTVHVAGAPYETPGKIVTTHSYGPSLDLTDLQAHAPDFKARTLNQGQTKAIEQYVDTIMDQPDVSYVGLTIVGNASDEDYTRSINGNRNLGEPSADNATLARDRGQLVSDVIQSYIQNKGYSGIEIQAVTGKEAILSQEDLARIDTMADRHHKTRDELISDFNHHRADYLDSDEAELLHTDFVLNRGASVTSAITKENMPTAADCDEIVEEHMTPAHDETVTVPGHDGWKLEIAPFPGFIPRRRKRQSKAAEAPEEPMATPQATTVPEPKAEAATPVVPEAEEPYDYTNALKRLFETPMSDTAGRKAINDEINAQGTLIDSRIAAARTRQEALEQAARRQRNINIARRGARIAGLLLLVPVIPLPWMHTEKADNTAPTEACATYTIDEGSRTDLKVTTLGQLVWAKFNHTPTPWLKLDTTIMPTTIQKTEVPHTKYVIDGTGNVISSAEVPATPRQPVKVAPHFADKK